MSEDQLPLSISIPFAKIDGNVRAVLNSPNTVIFQKKNKHLWPVVSVIAAVIASPLFLWITFLLSDRDGPPPLFMSILSALSLVSIAASILWVRARNRAPLDPFSAVHPLYLIRVRLHDVLLIPLWTVGDFTLTKHRTNGAYMYTHLTFKVNGIFQFFELRPHSRAEETANLVIQNHNRLIESMNAGRLSECEGIGLLFEADHYQTAAPAKSGAWWKISPKWVAAAVLLATGIHLTGHYLHQQSLLKPCEAGELDACTSYLQKHGAGFYADRLRARRDRLLDDGLATFLKKSGASPQLAASKGIAALISHLKRSGAERVPMRFTYVYRYPSDERLEALGLAPTEGTLDETRFQASANSFVESFVHTSTGLKAISTPLPADATERHPVEFHVTVYITGQPGEYYTMQDGQAVGTVSISWNVRMLNGETGEVYHAFADTIAAPERLSMQGRTDGSSVPPSVLYQEIAMNADTRFERGLIRSLGLDPGPGPTKGM